MKTKIIAVLIALVVLAGVGSAALLTYYNEMEGTADVLQSIIVDGNDHTTMTMYTIGSSAVAGNTYIDGPFPIENRADITGYIKFATSQEANYGGSYVDASDAVTTTYFANVTLENKDSSWNIVSDGIGGELTFELADNDFKYDFVGVAPLVNTEYCLIYYADEPNRFVNWGGDNPGKLIGAGTSDATGYLCIGNGVVNLEMDMPKSPDYNGDYDTNLCNLDRPNYCGAPDSYDMCTGAKVWLVPCSDYTEPALTAWNPTTYLFETDLITYDDTSVTENLFVGGNSKFDMYIKNTFDIAAVPGMYKITTTVSPA